MLSHVTFTGWDRHTDLDALAAFLTSHRPRTIEIAVLLSASRAGDDRYPDVGEAVAILQVARAASQRTAVHLCGRLARDMLTAPETTAPLIDAVLHRAERVQVNVGDEFWPVVDRYFAAGALGSALRKPIIVQVRDRQWPDPWHGVHYLFDRSAGNGLPIASAPRPRDRCGYAGGLGPDSVGPFLALLPGPALPDGGSFWIDMESGIRESSPEIARRRPDEPPAPTFVSVARCKAVMEAVKPYLGG